MIGKVFAVWPYGSADYGATCGRAIEEFSLWTRMGQSYEAMAKLIVLSNQIIPVLILSIGSFW